MAGWSFKYTNSLTGYRKVSAVCELAWNFDIHISAGWHISLTNIVKQFNTDKIIGLAEYLHLQTKWIIWLYINCQLDALIIIYSYNTILLHMFRASSAHLQEDKVVHMLHMLLSLFMRVPGGLSVHSLNEFSLKLCTDRPPGTLIESDSTICCMRTTVSS